jgi:hypothetical protein
MTKPIARFAAAVLLVGTVAGCQKKSEQTSGEAAPAESSAAAPEASPKTQPAAPAPGKEVLPGSASVRAALQKKDYDTAVGGLLALRGAATRSPQTEEYSALYDEVKFTLMDAAQGDSKAAAALMTLRAAGAGR